MKYYNFLTEDVLKAKTHWGKGGQYEAIKQIIQKYPSPSLFKKAVIQSGDKKSIKLIEQLDDNASKSDYIDFLQNVFTKYSATGKFLLSGLAGLGIGAATAYAAGKLADHTYDKAKGDYVTDPDSKFGKLLNKTGEKTYQYGHAIGDKLHRLNNNHNNGNQKVADWISTTFGAGAHNAESEGGPIVGNQVLGAKVLGGAAGMGAGTLGAYGVQSWRQKKIQNKIDALKK